MKVKEKIKSRPITKFQLNDILMGLSAEFSKEFDIIAKIKESLLNDVTLKDARDAPNI